MHDLNEFCDKCNQLDQIKWIMVLDWFLDQIWVLYEFLPNLVEYGKSYIWPWEIDWISYVNKWAYGNILSNFMKKVLIIE